MFQLSVVSVPVADQERARAFYEQVLDFKTRGEGDRDTDYGWILMTPPSGAAGITLVKPNPRQQPGQSQGVILQTLDLERLHEKLRERGLALSEIKAASWGRFANFEDPDGNGWVLAEPTLDL